MNQPADFAKTCRMQTLTAGAAPSPVVVVDQPRQIGPVHFVHVDGDRCLAFGSNPHGAEHCRLVRLVRAADAVVGEHGRHEFQPCVELRSRLACADLDRELLALAQLRRAIVEGR